LVGLFYGLFLKITLFFLERRSALEGERAFVERTSSRKASKASSWRIRILELMLKDKFVV